jgi:hypothetical protein
MKYGVYICDPTPWERKHGWRIPVFYPLITSMNPDQHGPWVLPRSDNGWTSEHICPGSTVANKGEHGYHSVEYFNRRRYHTTRLEKANQMAAKIRKAHPHLIVRVDEIPGA